MAFTLPWFAHVESADARGGAEQYSNPAYARSEYSKKVTKSRADPWPFLDEPAVRLLRGFSRSGNAGFAVTSRRWDD
jgi:hypothetical protein